MILEQYEILIYCEEPRNTVSTSLHHPEGELCFKMGKFYGANKRFAQQQAKRCGWNIANERCPEHNPKKPRRRKNGC